MQSLKFIDNNYTVSGFPLQCLFSVGYATPKLFLLNIIFLLFNQQVKPSEMQGQVDTLFPEVILCVEIYNSRKVKVLHFFGEIKVLIRYKKINIRGKTLTELCYLVTIFV